MARTNPLILMADDDPNFREIITEKLSSVGLSVEAVTNGADAVKAAGQLKPDLILMDIRMPGAMNGIDAAFAIKGNPETKDLKIAFLSDSENPWPAVVGERGEVSKEFGMEDFIPKTEYLDVFVGKVKQFLGMGTPPAPAAPAQNGAPPPPPAPENPASEQKQPGN